MNTLLLSMLIGLIIGIIDVLPMIFKKLPKSACISAFLQYFFLSIIILHTNIPYIPWWLKGSVIAFALSIPIVIIVADSDKKVVPIILGNAIFLGAIISLAGHYLI